MAARALAALILAALLAGCAPSEQQIQAAIAETQTAEAGSCSVAELATYADQMAQQITTFRRQADLVGAAPRMSIGEPLQRLLDVQTATRAIRAPGCVADHHARTVEAMDAHQRAYQAFAAQQLEAGAIMATLGEAGRLLDAAEDDLAPIRAGTPPPTPTPAPTPEPISPPERGVVGEPQLLLLSPGTRRGMFEVCEGDFFELFARSGEYVQVRITALGNGTRCSGVLPHVAVGMEGWLRDDAVFAP